MQSSKSVPVVLALLAAGSRTASADATESNPLGTVLTLMNDLTAKITADKEAEAKAYKEYFAWCDDASKNKGFEIKTATSQKEKLEATIAELTANMDAADTKIGELATAISTGDSDLASATSLREKEAADFSASEAELVEAVDTLSRALSILEREMAKKSCGPGTDQYQGHEFRCAVSRRDCRCCFVLCRRQEAPHGSRAEPRQLGRGRL